MEAWANLTDAGNRTADSADELRPWIEFRNVSRFWIQRVLVPLVVGIGVIGNVVTVVVLTRRRMRSSTNMYLTALAASDLLYLVFMLSLSLEHYPNIHDSTYYLYWQYKRFGHWFTDATSSSSIWLTVSFTVERYIAVCHPLRGKVLCTVSRALKVILLVFLACFVATVTTPFEWNVRSEIDPRDNVSLYMALGYSPLGKHKTYRTIFYWFSSITFMILPLILLGIFNSFLVAAVHRSQRQRRRMTQVDQHDNAQNQENRITIILIAVVVLFMVCQLPTATILIYTSFYPAGENSKEEYILQGLGNIFNFLVAVHSACNFLLYCALSDKYRRTFLVTFCCYKLPPTSSAASSANHSTMSVRLTQRGYSMRCPSSSTGNTLPNGVSCTDVPLKRHVSAYIPRPQNKVNL